MPTMDTVPATEDPIHLLLIADTKVGKSTYAAQAIMDGFTAVYLDGDNGISALRNAFKGNKEYEKRVHYLQIGKMSTFLTNFMRSNTAAPMKWMPRLNKLWGKMSVGIASDEKVWILDITKVPKDWVLVADSWTSTAADALEIGSADQTAELLVGTDQGIYGSANATLTYICNLMQRYPGHAIIQAHGGKYEIYEKPKGVTAGAAKQKDMVLIETIDVPLSSSRGHGMIMANRFNHIGWMNVNSLGETEIDFTRKPNRVGGGPPNVKKKVQDLPFSKLLPSIPQTSPDPGDWFIETTHESLLAAK